MSNQAAARKHLSVLLAALFALSVVAAPVSSADESAVRILGYTVSGSTVLVSLENTSPDPVTVTVEVVAVVGGEQVQGFTTVSLLGGQQATATVGFVDVVEDVIRVGTITEGQGPV